MSFIAGLLTFILVVNCLLLILLILVQLPKKDAGAWLAFGGGAADALFGAGSGNVLTKVTKWAAGVFFVLALFLGYFQDHLNKNNSVAAFEQKVQQKQMQLPISSPQAAPAPVSQPAAPPANNLLSVLPSAPTNAAEAPAQSK
jgi:preprotein translocase subunit SecG